MGKGEGRRAPDWQCVAWCPRRQSARGNSRGRDWERQLGRPFGCRSPTNFSERGEGGGAYLSQRFQVISRDSSFSEPGPSSTIPSESLNFSRLLPRPADPARETRSCACIPTEV